MPQSNSEVNPLSTLLEPRFLITILVILLFGWALSADPDDATMKGALIAGFAGAWGFWLGSSRGAADASARTDKALDIAHRAQDKASDPSKQAADAADQVADAASEKADQIKGEV